MTRGRRADLRRCIGVAVWGAVVFLGFASIGSGSAGAQVEQGNAQCLVSSGTISFNPPLVDPGGAPDAVTGSIRLTHCTAGKGPTPIRALAEVRATVEDSCAGILPLDGFEDSSLDTGIWWGLRSIAPTRVDFAGVSDTTSKNLELVIGGPNTTATGSYSGSDQGASSTATIMTGETVDEITKACSSAPGLSKVKVVGGSLHVG